LARTSAGFRVPEFAELIGVSPKTINNAESETSRHAVRPIVLNAWAMATGVPRQWLETGIAPTENDGGDGMESGRRDSNSQHSAWKAEASIIRFPLAVDDEGRRAA